MFTLKSPSSGSSIQASVILNLILVVVALLVAVVKTYNENTLTIGDGFVRIDESSLTAYNALVPVYRGGESTPQAPAPGVYSLSVFHQLHCLVSSKPRKVSTHSLRSVQYLSEMKRSLRWGYDVATKRDNLTALEESQVRNLGRTLYHMGHCGEYLRKSAMCSGDMALEPADIFAGGTKAQTSDWETTWHQCRNWGEIFGFAERFRYEKDQ
ncbi:hypothetical protein K402DRAFT_457833 [Aulographum hederae CBS 113979]|uniref:Uncharacterized protein n=1 Tax=Aulographum hederae CBS 113979 TaxID=1176131 RepID=A0A6G1GLZ2_9PEZI|nr:hypothetical protein K402DRAFT_457833 [Aulographum hederae CBS 113979]